jgi:hypothetical protein
VRAGIPAGMSSIAARDRANAPAGCGDTREHPRPRRRPVAARQSRRHRSPHGSASWSAASSVRRT